MPVARLPGIADKQAITAPESLLARPLPAGVGYLWALAAVAVVTGIIGLVLSYWRIDNISMLYLIAVLAVAITSGRGPAILVSLAAFLTFNWFFVEPLHSFTVYEPQEWVALILFLLTAVITGQLAAGQRRRAQEAEQREREAVVLYDVVQLMAESDLDRALRAVAERLREELRLAAVTIQIADGDGLATRATAGDVGAIDLAGSGSLPAAQILSGGQAPTDSSRGSPGRWVRIVQPRPPGPTSASPTDLVCTVHVRAGDRRVGAITLVAGPESADFGLAGDRLLSALAAQLGLAVERLRLRSEATEAEVLRRSDQLKSALLNAVSHDLRTPLATVIASAGSLLQRDVDWTDQERREFAEAIEQEALRLNRIVGRLLDFSRLKSGGLRPEKEWRDLAALVDDVLGRLKAATANHRAVVDIPEDLPPVPLDYVQIDQVLSNLIENAAKYSPPGTEIRVSARREGPNVRVEVADRGPGVPPIALPRLFEPFYRLESGQSQPKGTGLGLAVARGLVEAHGGRIRGENRPEGGCSFVFTLPLAEPVGAPSPELAS